LHRTPQNSEVQGWVTAMQQGLTQEQVALGFTTSNEHRGNLIAPDYQTYLRRDPEPGAVAGWLQLMPQGHSEPYAASLPRAPPEYFAAQRGANAPWLEGCDQDLLARPSDLSGRTGFLGTLQNGTGLQHVPLSILNSSEAHAHAVAAQYQQVLGRPA